MCLWTRMKTMYVAEHLESDKKSEFSSLVKNNFQFIEQILKN